MDESDFCQLVMERERFCEETSRAVDGAVISREKAHIHRKLGFRDQANSFALQRYPCGLWRFGTVLQANIRSDHSLRSLLHITEENRNHVEQVL